MQAIEPETYSAYERLPFTYCARSRADCTYRNRVSLGGIVKGCCYTEVAEKDCSILVDKEVGCFDVSVNESVYVKIARKG